jgi:hypothetical protein
MSITIAAAVATAEAAALNAAIGSNPTISLYTGTKPASPDIAATGTLLVTIPLTGFTAAADVLTSNDPAAVSAVATGTAGWFRIASSAGVAALDGTVAESGEDLNLSNTAVTAGTLVDLGALTVTAPES